MKKIFCFFIMLLSLADFYVFADIDPDQPYHPTVVPTSPTAYSLGQYGNIPVNLSTGAPNVTIPIHTLTCRNATLQISLSYMSNGIKVDEVASWVGLGWSLNAGGVISRTIRGGPDENTRIPLPEGLEENIPGTVTFLNYAVDNNIDTEPDIYTFNFDGHTGKFVLGKNDSIVGNALIPYSNLKIEAIIRPDSGCIESFLITTAEGIKYTFGSIDSCYDQARIYLGCNKRTYDYPDKTAWYLRQIDYPTGEKFYFEYKKSTYKYYSGISQTIRKLTYTTCPENPCLLDEYGDPCPQLLAVETWALKKIWSSEGDSVIFKSNKQGRLDLDSGKLDSILVYNSKGLLLKRITYSYIFPRATSFYPSTLYNDAVAFHGKSLFYHMFLTELEICGRDQTPPQKFYFDYYDPSQMPSRLSFCQDHWGYFNNEPNQDFVVVPENLADKQEFQNIFCNRETKSDYSKFGLLKMITYPTGGYDSIEYEQNTYSKLESIQPPPVIIQIDTVGLNCSDPNSKSVEFTVPISQTQSFGSAITFDSISCSYSHNKHFGKVKLVDLTDTVVIINNALVKIGSPVQTEVEYIQNHTYRITVTAKGDGTEIFASTEYYDTLPTPQLTQKLVGGLRIKKVSSFDNISGQKTIMRYFYGDTNNLEASSGVPGMVPRYHTGKIENRKCQDGENHWYENVCRYIILYSNSLTSLYNINGTNIMYRNVVISHGNNFENGGEYYSFLVEPDEPAEPVAWSTNFILDAPQTNTSWNNGLLLNQLTFKKNGVQIIPIKEIRNVYSEDPRRDSDIFGYVFRKMYDPLLTGPYTYVCTEHDCEWFIWLCKGDHSNNLPPYNRHIYDLGLLGKCVSPHCDNYKQYNECHELGVDSTITNYTLLDNFDGMKYEILCKWSHLDSIIVRQFDTAGQNPVTEFKTFFYNNPVHAMQNKVLTINSKGDTLEEFVYYPQDFSQLAINNNFQDLVNKHIINLPVDNRRLVNKKLVSGETIKYDKYGQPIEIFLARNELGQPFPFDSNSPYSYGIKEREFSYDSIDHAIISDKIENNVQTNYLWAYNAGYPVARVIGSSYQTISEILQQGGYSIELLWSSFDSLYITNAISYLRSQLTSCMITSYTYIPQIGMTSQTDESGLTTYYEYDGSGRLVIIRDNDRNILKKIEYHYAERPE